MGVSTQSAMSLMADALDLRHRFPLLWAKVEAGSVAPYKTRRVADDTRSLPYEAARWVDEELAARVNGFGIPTIQRLVALAAARFAPEEQAEKEQAAESQWHVTLTHPRPGEFAGTSWLEAAGDTQDLTAFYDLVCAEAKQPRPAGRHRRLRDPQGQGARHHRRPSGQPGVHRPGPRRPHGHPPTGPDEPLRPRLARRPGHATLPVKRRWVRWRSSAPPPSTSSGPGSRTRRPPSSRCSTSTGDAVDQHDPPPRMREQVILRDRHCVFPWCGTRRPTLGPRPHHPLRPARRRRTTGPDQPPEPGALVPATPPRQDLHRLDLPTRPRRHPHLDQPPRTHLDRRTRRHHAPRLRARPHPTPRTEPRRTRSPPEPRGDPRADGGPPRRSVDVRCASPSGRGGVAQGWVTGGDHTSCLGGSTVTPELWTSDHRVVPSAADASAPAVTDSSWVVENGRPGAIPA